MDCIMHFVFTDPLATSPRSNTPSAAPKTE
jgi:hypothetical protein